MAHEDYNEETTDFALICLLPTASAEISHNPKEVSEGETFTAIIDAEEDVKVITFYVCTLEEPYTCYKPEKKDRNDSVNDRYQFTYTVKSNDFPGYKYELEKEDNSTEEIPLAYTKYDGLEVEEMGDSYYFKVNMKQEEAEEESLLTSPTFIPSITAIIILVLTGRK